MKRLVLAIVGLVAFSTVPATDPPALVNYQGVLRDALDKPRAGTFDMVFRFFDASTAGTEILVDAHTGGGGNAVTVTGGLFNVQLGGGTVTDGPGPGTYTSLDQVFRDYGTTYLQITVGAEVLSPRIRIQSAAYALNASNLQGRPASSFVDTTGNSQIKAGHLVANDGLEGNSASAVGVQGIGASSGGTFANDQITAIAHLGYNHNGNQEHYGVYGQGTTAGGWFRDTDNGSTAYVGYGGFGILASGATGGYFEDGSGDTAQLANSGIGVTAIGTTYGVVGAGQSYGARFLNGVSNATAYLSASNGALNNAIYGWSNGYYEAPGYFLDVFEGGYAYVGTSTAKIFGNGAVSFVQNDPFDASRMIQYTAPEGDEAAVYTRGTARLAHGSARVKLGATFAWVANPDTGLTVQLTPRGEAIPLAVESVTTSELVVRGPSTGPDDLVFDYAVWGLRIGFEDRPVVRPKMGEAFIPSMERDNAIYTAHPTLKSFNARQRFARMEADAGPERTAAKGNAASEALKAAIHVYDREVDRPKLLATSLAAAGAIRATSAAPEVSRLPSSPGAPRATDASSPVFPSNTTAVQVTESVEAGDILANDPRRPGELRRASLADDPGIVGIVAGEAGATWSEWAPLALAGAVFSCKVDASYGPIAPNELLVASPTPGHAMRAGENPRQGTVVGKALEPWEAGTGTIRVLVMSR